MRFASELIGLRRMLFVGVILLFAIVNFTDLTIMGIVVWCLFLLLGIVYVLEVVFYAIKTPRRTKVGTLFWLVWRGLTAKHLDIKDVKGYYTQEHYDWITDVRFPESILHTRREAAMSLKARQYIINSKVLDLGCGTGLITRVLPGEVTGVDISPWKIERARQHCPHASFIVDDIEELTSIKVCSYYDVVVFTDVLEHLERPDKAIQRACEVLRPYGVIIGTLPTRHVIWKLRRFLTTADASGEPFHIHYNEDMVRKLLHPLKPLEISSQCLGLEWFFAVSKEGGHVA